MWDNNNNNNNNNNYNDDDNDDDSAGNVGRDLPLSWLITYKPDKSESNEDWRLVT